LGTRSALKQAFFVREGAAPPRFRAVERIVSLSYGDRGSGNAIFQGDNLPILAELLPAFREKVRCIYIDPPYNNDERYAHYDDTMGHERWLKEITARLELLSQFLREDGSLWVSIDDTEIHYLKVAADRIMGRKNFVATVVWQHRLSRENRKVFSNNHEYLLVYARNARKFGRSRNLLPVPLEIKKRYRNPDDDPRGPWQSVSANVQAGHATPSQFYRIVGPTGRSHDPPNGRCWVYSEPKMHREISKRRVWFGRNGDGVPRLKRFLDGARTGVTPQTLWTAQEAGTTDLAKKHLLDLFPRMRLFDTPKPELLVHRIIQIASDPGDLVLDAYLGSGTTAAVAHKTGRRYIAIENGRHAITHCARRLRRVVEGEKGGISELVGWEGGGGYDFFRLTP